MFTGDRQEYRIVVRVKPSDRVLKMELLRATPTSALERLRPDTLVLTAEYPAIVVFRLNDKDAVTADDNMVDLRCFPINCR